MLKAPIPIVVRVAALLLAATPATAQWREDIDTLRIGFVAGADAGYALARAEPLRLELEARLGVRVDFTAEPGYAALIDRQVASLDAAFLSASAFAQASLLCGCVEPLAIPLAPDGTSGYHAILVVGAASAIATVADLAGVRLAVSAPDSVAGRLLPLRLFAEEGVAEADLGALVERDSPVAAIEALLAGEADAALAWSSLTGAAAAGYDRGTLTDMVAAGTLAMDGVRIAWTSPLVPYGPLSVHADLPPDLKADLFAALQGIAEAAPEALAAIPGYLGGGFATGNEAMFAPLEGLVAGTAEE